MKAVISDPQSGRRRKMATKSPKLGERQREAYDYIKSVGGAANTYDIQQHTNVGINSSLHRLVKRGILKQIAPEHTYMPGKRLRDQALSIKTVCVHSRTGKKCGQAGSKSLSKRERASLAKARKRQPRANVFWVLDR